jgi:hypothetical protein
MKNNRQPVPFRNLERWGKWLLPAGLILVAILGFLQLYPVQAVFSPEKYQENQLKLINEECAKIERNLQRLVIRLADLQNLVAVTENTRPGAMAGSSSPALAATSEPRVCPGLPPRYAAVFHAAKKERVFAARKLEQLAFILNAMQRTLDSPDTLSQVQRAIILSHIHTFRARCRAYNEELYVLSAKLNKFADYCGGIPTTNQDYYAVF